MLSQSSGAARKKGVLTGLSRIKKKSAQKTRTKIGNKEDFFKMFDFLEETYIDQEDQSIFAEHKFYPVKDRKTNKIYIITPNPRFWIDVTSDVGKRDILRIMLKYIKKAEDVVYLDNSLFFEIIERTSLISSKDYTEDLAGEFYMDLLQDASRKQASDIHMTWLSDSVEIKYRIDGKLVRQTHIKKELGDAVRNILVAESGASEYEENEVSGQITKIIDGVKREFRLSIGPTIHGYNIVIRKESSVNKHVTLEDRGYSPKACKLIRKMFKKHHGIVLATGPTGSGKTTLLTTCIIEKLNEHPKYVPEILTVEDPVEIVIDGINQTQVNTKGDPDKWITFASAIKMFLRQDPDMIVVGEIRDKEVAMQAVTAAKTGHLTASTLHTNDVASTFTRLRELGVDNANIEDAIVGVISQRLINKLCSCKLKDEKNGRTFYKRNPVGCANCMDSPIVGYKDRVPITEIAVLTLGKENYKPENFEDYYSWEENIIYLLENGIIDEEEASRYVKMNFKEDIEKRKEMMYVWSKATSQKKAGLKSTNLYPVYQTVIDDYDYPIGYETFMRVKNTKSEVLYPSYFIPILIEMNIYKNFAMYILDMIIQESRKFDKLFFWNIFSEDIEDKNFVENVVSKIKGENVENKIVVELPFKRSETFKDFVERCNEEKIQICINSFEGNVNDLIFIHRNGLKIDFVKTGESFIKGVQQNEGWVDQYLGIVDSIGDETRIIASYIETQKLFQIVKERFGKKFYAYQGFGIDHPKENVV